MGVNKYMGKISSSYDKFEESIKKGETKIIGQKVIMEQGTFLERIISRKLSFGKIGLGDRIKNFVFTIFSPQYRKAKSTIEENLKTFRAKHYVNKTKEYINEQKSDPYIKLYRQRVGDKAKELKQDLKEDDKIRILNSLYNELLPKEEQKKENIEINYDLTLLDLIVEAKDKTAEKPKENPTQEMKTEKKEDPNVKAKVDGEDKKNEELENTEEEQVETEEKPEVHAIEELIKLKKEEDEKIKINTTIEQEILNDLQIEFFDILQKLDEATKANKPQEEIDEINEQRVAKETEIKRFNELKNSSKIALLLKENNIRKNKLRDCLAEKERLIKDNKDTKHLDILIEDAEKMIPEKNQEIREEINKTTMYTIKKSATAIKEKTFDLASRIKDKLIKR